MGATRIASDTYQQTWEEVDLVVRVTTEEVPNATNGFLRFYVDEKRF